LGFSLHPALLNTNIKEVERIIAGVNTAEKMMRPPIMDGLFYPEDPDEILRFMQNLGLERGKGGTARAIIAPHGAWEISGSLAGAAFASAAGRKKPLRVVILGPVHDNFEEGIFLTRSGFFQTPLGDIPVDRETSEWIETYSPLITANDNPHLREHSIEVLLPFIKYLFPRALIVPILLGGQRKQHIRVLANALRAVLMPEMDDTLIVVSFNMTVNGIPGNKETNMPDEFMRLFREGKYNELNQSLQSGKITGCGSALISALLQSRLLEKTRPFPAHNDFLCARGERDKNVYYGGFAFV